MHAHVEGKLETFFFLVWSAPQNNGQVVKQLLPLGCTYGTIFSHKNFFFFDCTAYVVKIKITDTVLPRTFRTNS